MSMETLEAKDKLIAKQKKWLVRLYILMVILLMGLYPLLLLKL